MLQNKNIKKKRKFRFLLDSAFASTGKFPKLSKKAKLIHPVHDLGLSAQVADENIDILITEFIAGKNPDDFIGKATKI